MQTPEPGLVGLALIVKNSAQELPTLLASIEGAFDEIALVDTGSTDTTVQLFEDWCAQEGQRNPAFAYTISEFEWCDDFAKARNHADSLLRTPWRVWADSDDELHGAEHLRTIAQQADPGAAGFVMDYDYAHDHHGNVTCVLKRERLVRAGMGVWEGRVHEAQNVHGSLTLVDREVVRWVHRKPDDKAGASSERNVRILEAWEREEPENPRVLAYLGTEAAIRSDHEAAVGYFHRYLQLKTGWDEERCQIHRKLGVCLLALGRAQEALETALAALAVIPDWPDSHLTLAQATYTLGEHAKAIKWAREVLRLGQPHSMLILNPMDYTFQPRLVLAAALGALGDFEQARAVATEALQLVPDHPELHRLHAHASSELKRHATAHSWIDGARLLVAHDEQLKALTMLEETVPVFVKDHPDVVRARSEIRERLMWANRPQAYAEHYGTGGSKPEDPHTDEQALAVCEQLPRAHFLRDGLREQLAEAA
jgi:tetratricopeptide (TPR) repeat protein